MMVGLFIFSHSTVCVVVFSGAPAGVWDNEWFLGAYYVLGRADLHNGEDDHWAIQGGWRWVLICFMRALEGRTGNS